jgi:thymidylate synthase (FAD)
MFDFNKARVIGVTTPILATIPDSAGIVAYAARVSNPLNQDNFETAGKLLKYCVDHGHYSVFETVNLVMEIETPRDIARQMLRHRSFSFQEFSQRYAEAQSFVSRECRLQDSKNRQNSILNEDPHLSEWWESKQKFLMEVGEGIYKEALEKGVAKEVARVLLPEGLTMSRLYMNGTLRSWMHYCNLRDGNGTQSEHIDIAQKCKEEVMKHFPFMEGIWANDNVLGTKEGK